MSNIHTLSDFRSSGSSSSSVPYRAAPTAPPSSSRSGQPSRFGTIGSLSPAPTTSASSYNESVRDGVSFVTDPSTPAGEYPTFKQRCCPRIGWRHLTTVIFFVDTIILIIELIVGSSLYGCAFAPDNQMGGPTTTCLYCMGAKYEPDIHNGAVWRLITPIFLHAGILHLAMNMFMLLRFGYVLEARWGWWKFGLVYLLAGISASLWSAVLGWEDVSVGASGSIMGIMGADITYIIYNWHEIPQVKIEAVFLAISLLINFLIGGFSKGIDNYAHVGGFISGLALGVWFVPHPEKREKERLIRIVAGSIFCGLFLLFVLLLFVGTPGGKDSIQFDWGCGQPGQICY